MLKLLLITFLTIFFISTSAKAEWISLNNNRAPHTPPIVTLQSDDNFSTVIKIELAGFELKDFNTNGKTYQYIDLLSDAVTTQPGYPELPYIAKILAIPDQAGITVEVLETSAIQSFLDVHLLPARPSWIEGEPEPPYEENFEHYRSNDIYPEDFSKTDPPAVFRDFRIARVAVYPVRYIPGKDELQAVSSITVRVNYGAGEVINPKTTSTKPIAPSFAKLYRSFIFNYQSVLNRNYNREEGGHDIMLCIMPDNYYDDFLPYAEWKHKSGTEIHITKFSDIGANANNPDIIKNHITNVYNNWPNPPTHILLLGDYGYFPVKYITYDYTFMNEDYFVEIEGNDFFPEMMIGRFTHQTPYRLEVMVNKFLHYEKYPYTVNTDWFKKGICCSNNAYVSQIKTKRFAANVMMEDGGFISVDTLMSDFPCSMNLTDVKNAINDGRSFLNYRGEGWSSGWWADCYPFHTGDVTSINNGEMLTFVTSIGCGVAKFDASGGNCFGEAWLQLGSLTDIRGACAFVGPTSNTHTTYNNKIDKGIYVGMFREGLDTPGQALLRGKLYMYNVFGNTMWVEYHYRVYCVLGDPSMHIWKEIPRGISVNHPIELNVGFNQSEITVYYTPNEIPVQGAQVCIAGDSIYAVGYTDENGEITLSVLQETVDTLSITVRGGDILPYEGTINIIQQPEYVTPFGDPIIDDLDGNNDGLINPNENGQITFTLKNWGTQTAQNVHAMLTVIDTNYATVLTTTPISYGDLIPGGSNTGDPFQFFIEPHCPVGYSIRFKLEVTSTSGTWSYTYPEEIKGCRLVYKDSRVDDYGEIMFNYRMDPGETVKLFLTIENNGEDIAPDIYGILRSNNTNITINDSVGTFETLLPDRSASNTNDYYVVSVDPSCPTNYLADYSLELYTQNGNYPYTTTQYFKLPVSVPMGVDPTGPDTYGYYAYASDDTLYIQAPTYDWFEISTTGTLIPKPYGVSDFTQTVNLPFTFKYYGTNYNQLRINSDGWVAFGSGTQTAWENFPLPHNDDINCMVAVFWDDLFSNATGEIGKLYYKNDSQNHRFIVEWYQVGHYSDFEDRETFQLILLNPAYYPTPTGDGEIIFQYKSLTEEGSCTIGIENANQAIGLQYVFDDDYDTTATRLKNNFAIRITTITPDIVPVKIESELETNILPQEFNLEQNYPNPFNPQTQINYSLPQKSNITLKIYNVRGQLIRTLHEGEQSPGQYKVIWDGLNEKGTKVSSGIYFYRMTAEGSVTGKAERFVQTKKLVLLK